MNRQVGHLANDVALSAQDSPGPLVRHCRLTTIYTVTLNQVIKLKLQLLPFSGI
jgi:hypothetical protein